jgi:hypothetical protein
MFTRLVSDCIGHVQVDVQPSAFAPLIPYAASLYPLAHGILGNPQDSGSFGHGQSLGRVGRHGLDAVSRAGLSHEEDTRH